MPYRSQKKRRKFLRKWLKRPHVQSARRKANTEWHRKNGRAWMLQRKYGLSVEAFEVLAQFGCQICSSEEDLSVDHDHTSGRVRGVLCRHCNLMLGHAKDSADRLQLAALYLRRREL